MGIREATGLAGFCTKVDFLRENTSKNIILYYIGMYGFIGAIFLVKKTFKIYWTGSFL